MNNVIHYLYNCRVSSEVVRNELEINGNRAGGGDQGAKNVEEKNEILTEREEKAENSKDLITGLTTALIQNAVRAYVHGVCAVSLKATQALGDLHLVDKEEQSKKNKGI